MSIATGPAGGVFNSAATTYTNVAAVKGQATFSSIVLDTAGTTYSFTATDTKSPDTGFAPVTSTPDTVIGPTGTVTQFALTGSATMAAGATNNLTIVAEDTYGNKVTTYTGSQGLVFSGASTALNGTQPTVTNSSGTAINFGSTTAINFTSGQASVSGSNNGVMSLYKAETASIVVTQGSISNSSNPLQVIVSSTGTTTQFSLGAATTTPTAGAADNLTITAEDTYGNTVTTYTGSKSLTFSGASAIGSNNPTVTNASASATNFGTAESITFASGVASPTTTGASGQAEMTLYQTGTDSIVVSAGSINNGSGLSVTVGTPGASQLVFGQPPSNAYVGLSMSPAVTVLIEDQYGNLTSSNSSIALTITTNPCGGSPVVTNGTVSAVSGTATFSSLQISKECIGYALTATDGHDGNLTIPSTTFTVSAIVTTSANVLQDAATDAGGSGMNSVTYYRCSGFTTSCSSGAWTMIGLPSNSPPFQVNWTSLPANGPYSIVAVGTDNASNSTTSTPPIPVTVDGTGPTGGAISVPTYANTLSVTITTTNFSDSISGMAGNVITRSNAQAPTAGVCPTSGYMGNNTVSSNPDTGVVNGNCYEYTLTGTANDGSSSNVTSNPVLVDTVAPVTTITLNPASPNGTNGWYDGTSPTFTLSASDTGGSGVATTYYKIDGGTATVYPGSAVTIPDGSAQTISYWSVDKAGNVETTHTTSALKIDTVAPVTTITLNPASPNGSGGWYKGTSPTFTLSATDTGGSGVTTTYYEIDGGTQTVYPGSAVTIPNGSAQTISYWSVDNAGNIETVHTTAGLKIDTVAPATTITLSPASPNGSNSWYNGTSPTFTLSASDTGGSGVATTYYKIDGGTQTVYPGSAVTIPDGSAQTISYWSVDNAGNTETTHTTAALKIDTVAPTGSITAPAANATVSGSAVTVSSNSADSGSGVASAVFQYSAHNANTWTTIGTDTTSPYSVSWNTTSLSSGSYDLRVVTTDVAGNVTTSAIVTVTVHNIALVGTPSSATVQNATSLTIPAPSNLTTGDVLLAQVTARDNLTTAGVTTITAPSGWTEVPTASFDGSATIFQFAYWCVVGSTGCSTSSPSWTWSWPCTSNSCGGLTLADGSGGIFEFSGVNTTTPIDVAGVSPKSSGSPVTAPSVTTSSADDEIVAMFASGGTNTFSGAPSGTDAPGTPNYDVGSANTGSCNGTADACSSNAASAATTTVLPTAGATGTYTLACANATYAWIASTVALEP